MKLLGVAGFSGAGKTTLIEGVLPRLALQGVRVSVIKHAHHGFDIDRPGKDTYRFREAGAFEVLVGSARRWVLMHEVGAEEPTLEEQVGRLSPCDLVIVEGYKSHRIPKIEVHRPVLGHPCLFERDPDVIAVASDGTIAFGGPVLPLNDIDLITQFIMEFLDDGEQAARTAFA